MNKILSQKFGLKSLFIGKKKLQPFFKKLHSVGLRGMNYSLGSSVDISGEKWFLKKLKSHFGNNYTPVIFDIGSNDGDYGKIVLDVFNDQLTLHCFEPSPYSYEKLKNHLGHSEHVIFNNFGISTEEKKALLFFDSEGTAWSTLHAIDHFHRGLSLNNSREIQLKTMYQYCQELNIEHIDFLKIDVEGHEIKVLESCQFLLEKERIDIIQFEHGIGSMASRIFMRDFYLYLNNYTIYRILQDGLFPLGKYTPVHEIFDMSTNYIAIRKGYKFSV